MMHCDQELQPERPSGDDRKHLSGPMHQGSSLSSRTAPTLHVAMVFPKLSKQPVVPSADSFAGEDVDFVLFPEGYICSSDKRRTGLLKKLASDLGAPLLVGWCFRWRRLSRQPGSSSFRSRRFSTNSGIHKTLLRGRGRLRDARLEPA